jgi:formamidopyrimidine-DNA glycosylase
LGPEPFSESFHGGYLRARSKGRKGPVKNFLMDGTIVVGVGNIYASESLFLAGIHPHRASGRISTQRYGALVDAVRQVLSDAIAEGGTTLRDFTAVDGDPGYFRTQLNVYGRSGAPCSICGKPIRRVTTGQRATYYCPGCQR